MKSKALCCTTKRKISNDSVVPRELEQEIRAGAEPGSFHQVCMSSSTKTSVLTGMSCFSAWFGSSSDAHLCICTMTSTAR